LVQRDTVATPVIGPLFARTVALPLGELLLGGGAASVFAPQPMPKDYVRRAAIRLLLRPAQFIANAQDIAVLKAFVTAQAPRVGARHHDPDPLAISESVRHWRGPVATNDDSSLGRTCSGHLRLSCRRRKA
jgi:hypothetical protein